MVKTQTGNKKSPFFFEVPQRNSQILPCIVCLWIHSKCPDIVANGVLIHALDYPKKNVDNSLVQKNGDLKPTQLNKSSSPQIQVVQSFSQYKMTWVNNYRSISFKILNFANKFCTWNVEGFSYRAKLPNK